MASLNEAFLPQIDGGRDMQLKIATDYAIRIVLYLSVNQDVVTSKELSDNLGIPQSFVFKITNKLKKEKLIKNSIGMKGGFLLTCKPEEISLYQIINLLESTMQINRCLEEDHYCSRYATETCPVRKFYVVLQKEVEDSLKKMTVKQLMDS